ncbi:MAG TPA: 3-ketoacyl-ACP reductase [Castellaniella sp.]|uniref:3-ketoacyl-ACP reductase n=1 Tax=Castellaniella sp. TaxID=1955812 RepID=UPI002F182CA8
MADSSAMRRVAIVTGGRRGIGRSICHQLAQAGFDLVLNDRVEDEAFARTLVELRELGSKVEPHAGDISDLQGHAALVDAAYRRFGRLDALVNNAGIQVRNRGDLLDVTPERFDESIAVNLRGTFFLTQQAARRMIADGGPASGRSIVIVSSSNAALVSPEKGEYCVSKSGLSMTAKLFAVRLAQAGISVYEIRPGLIRTDMTAEVREKYGAQIEQGISPVRRWGEPADVGVAVASLVSGRIPFATGIAVDIDGGLLIPRL